MKRAEAWGIAACGAAGALSVALSWNRWLDPIIDAGRDLYVPLRLAEGAHLYRDIAYNYPPLTPYALAALVRIFGSSFALYVAVGFVIAAVTAGAIYVVARGLWGFEGAFAATLMFVTICVAGRPNFNFFFPYAHSMTFGAMFMMLYFATLWPAIGLLACATKLEFAAVVIAHALFLRRWKTAAMFALVAFVVSPLPAGLVVGASGFYSHLAFGDYRQMLLGAAILACVAVLSRVPRAIWLAPLFVLVSADTLFAATPLVHVALLPLARSRRALQWLLIASVISTLRVAFNVTPSFNGFAYVLPTIVLFVYAAFTFFPKPLWMALFVGISLHALWRPPQTAVRVTTAHGSYLDVDASRGRVVQEIVRTLPSGTLAVIPEGVSINYFADRRSPLRTYLFTPPEFDETATRDFAVHPPDLVLLVPRRVDEYGSRGFGVDYGQSLASLIHTRYEHVKTYRDGYYAAELWRRR
jgi:hypothetical protein